MPINSNEKWKKIEKNKKYFDVNNRERKKFSELKDELKDVCELCVRKDFSIYKIEFLDKKGKSIHLPYVYRSKQVFKQKFGIDPIEFIQIKGLMGDSSDNIPGVPGVGEKTAFSLIQKFKTLDFIYKVIK